MKLRTRLQSALVAGALGAAVPAPAAPPPQTFDSRRSDSRRSDSSGDEAAVARCFRSALNRDPHPYEVRRYTLLMDDYGWNEEDVRKDLAERSDYRRYSAGSKLDANAIITRAYEDILGRKPDPSGMQSYRKHIVEEGWSERDVRESVRQSPEYRSTERRTASADGIIRRAYRDVLNRDPEPDGMDTYRQAILENGWDEQDVRQVLRRGDVRRGSRAGESGGRGRDRTTDRTAQVVRRAYLAILKREPDAAGLRDYGARVEQDHWSQADVEKALRESPEYRTKNR